MSETPKPSPAIESSELEAAHDATERPTQDEIVSQIEESEQNRSGPNELLRRNMEMYSKFTPLYRCLGLAVVGAVFLPAILAFVWLQLQPYFELSTLRGSVSRGLLMLFPALFAGLVLARAVRPNGLAERHFNWSPVLCEGLLKSLNIMIWVWLPLRFLYTALETYDGSLEAGQPLPGHWDDSLGRVLFIVSMMAFTCGLWLTARALKVWMLDPDRSSHWLDGIRGLILWFLPLMPASLAVMSALGYQFTAVEMSWRMMWTVILMIGISMAGGLISRMLLIAQFRIKLRQLSRNDDGQISSDESIDISGISRQVNRLLRATALVVMVAVGWQIWSEVLPAVNYLDLVQLPWKKQEQDGLNSVLTLRHLLMAFSAIVVTFILSRNLPGLLEITLLDRLPLDRGGRYAISFVVRYLVGIAGILSACNIIGFTWHNVQWLAAGLTVGLGFGLQEIFANVISGIIILIERPIRVGDVVTVNNTTGTVTQMKLRATTIKDLDFRELIVPNKKFITEDVMNWTLTDRRSRIVVPIGVAYGSDTNLVQKTLLKVAGRHPLVQDEPSPDVFFREFGDSTLNFQLRVFIPSREIFAKVQHELNMAIEAEFRVRKIEIAFPQRDIHIKNLGDLPIARPPAAPHAPSGGQSPFEKSTGEAGSAGGTQGASARSASARSASTMGEDDFVDPNNTDSARARLGSQLSEGLLGEDLDRIASDVLDPGSGISRQNRIKPASEIRRVVPFPLREIRGKQNTVLPPESRDAS
ncbi:MAG: potassium efflux system protein [Mariniblastus sp.]|jgi:potassium efflux system protein